MSQPSPKITQDNIPYLPKSRSSHQGDCFEFCRPHQKCQILCQSMNSEARSTSKYAYPFYPRDAS